MSDDPLSRCDVCGFYKDTPNHQLGCSVGRAEQANDATPSKHRAWTVVPGDSRALTIRSYEDGDPVDSAFVVHESAEIRALERELDRSRSEYRQLQELTGSAIVRAHTMRGDRELEAAKAHESEDALYEAIDDALNVMGFGGCHIPDCEGCRFEFEEARTLLIVALAVHDGEACPRCGGERWEKDPGPDGVIPICSKCGGTGTTPGYEPPSWRKAREWAARREADE